jgi:hypothetical protein
MAPVFLYGLKSNTHFGSCTGYDVRTLSGNIQYHDTIDSRYGRGKPLNKTLNNSNNSNIHNNDCHFRRIKFSSIIFSSRKSIDHTILSVSSHSTSSKEEYIMARILICMPLTDNPGGKSLMACMSTKRTLVNFFSMYAMILRGGASSSEAYITSIGNVLCATSRITCVYDEMIRPKT